MIPTILIGEISGCLEGFYIPIVVGVRILGFHGFPVLFLASDGMRILLQRATDHERQEGLSELHANATGLRPGAMGVPSVRCFFCCFGGLLFFDDMGVSENGVHLYTPKQPFESRT